MIKSRGKGFSLMCVQGGYIHRHVGMSIVSGHVYLPCKEVSVVQSICACLRIDTELNG